MCLVLYTLTIKVSIMSFLFRITPKFILNRLGRKLNKRVKRYFLLTSLWAHINNYRKDAIDKETLSKLNMIMHLVDNSDCLYIPALLGKTIWKDSLGNTVQLDNIDVDIREINKDNQLFEQLLNSIPQWLKYDKRDIIEKEIHNLLNSYPILKESK